MPFHGQPLPLAAVYVLSVAEAGAAVRIDRLSRRDAVIELLQCSFVLDVTDRGRLLAQFDRLTRDLPLTIHRIAYQVKATLHADIVAIVVLVDRICVVAMLALVLRVMVVLPNI